MARKSSIDGNSSVISDQHNERNPFGASSPYLSPSKLVEANASRYAQGPLARVLDEAPYLARCSDNKTAAIVRPREHSLRYPYMQVNRADMVSWLVFDLDHANSIIWEDAGLPPPNLIVRSRDNGHAHLFYAIPSVCTSNSARSKPIQYMRSVYRSMAERLQADPAYSGPVAKTPGHPWWHTLPLHNEVYSLGELADYLELEETRPWPTTSRNDANTDSRHCLLFDAIRYFAYSIVNKERSTGSYEQFYNRVDVYAQQQNNFRTRGFSANLTYAQVRATIKSVARWTWDKYQGRGGRLRGVMQLDPALPLLERQRLGAAHTHAARKQTTIRKIERACQALVRRHESLTQRAVARLAGVARQTVAKYREILERAESTPVPAIRTTPLPTAAAMTTANNESVNYGMHQITARIEGAFKKGTDQEGVEFEAITPAPT